MRRLFSMALAGVMLFSSAAFAQNATGTANVSLVGAQGQSVGVAKLRSLPKGILVSMDVNGLAPGWHGVHIHGVGNCADHGNHFQNAGGHAALAWQEHGYMNEKGPHMGDLPNMWVGADGSGKAEFYTDLMMQGDLQDADGSAIMIHAGADDYRSQPAGGSGERVACGVISP
ncbi:MAG TPA: superoxide dismutase family protein [Alphaproteobacteria bacterium]